MLYAILIFAKRAPKMINELLKLKGDGVGLKGLNIKNKMGEAALVGDKVKKGMTTLEGRTKGTLGGAAAGFIGTKGGLKAKLAGAGKGAITGGKKGAKIAKETGSTKGVFGKQYKDVAPIARGGQPSIWDRAKGKVGGFIDKNINEKGFTSSAAANAKDFASLQKRLTAMYGADKANSMIKSLGNINFSNGTEYAAARKKVKGWTDAFTSDKVGGGFGVGDADSRYIKQNVLSERQKVFQKMSDYDQQIATQMQSLNPVTQQALANRDMATSQLSQIDEQMHQTDINLETARNALANATTDEMRQRAQVKIDEYTTVKANLHSDQIRLEREIQSYDVQLQSDSSYSSTMQVINTLREEKQASFDKAVADHVFEANGGSGLDLGVDALTIGEGANKRNIESLEDLIAIMDDASNKNDKALNGVTKEIEESGKPAEKVSDDK